MGNPAGPSILSDSTPASATLRWRWALVVATAVAVAVVAPAGSAHRPHPGPDAAHQTRATLTAARPVALRRPVYGPGSRVLVVGDSLAESLIPGLEASASAAGVELSSRAYGGCGLLTGVPLDPTAQPYPWGQACNDSRPAWQTQSVQQLRPDVVVWLGAAWDERDRIVDGTVAQIGTVAGDQVVLQLIDEAAQRLTSTGARLVILTAAPDRGSQLAADPSRNPRLAELNRLLRLYAVLHQDQVVDLDPIICGGAAAPQCPETVDGVVMRPDGYHIGPSASPVVAQQVLPLVLGGGGGAPPDAGAADTFAALLQREPSVSRWSEISHPWRPPAAA